MRILTQDVMNRVLDVVDELEISREAITVPLEMSGPGAVRRLPRGKLEITLPAEDEALEAFLASLPGAIAALASEPA